MWFYEGHKGTNAYHIWKEGLQYLETNITPFIEKNENQIADKMVNFFHWYKIGPIKNDKV